MSTTQLIPGMRLLYHARYEEFDFLSESSAAFRAELEDESGYMEIRFGVVNGFRCDATEVIKADADPNLEDALEMAIESPLVITPSDWLRRLQIVFPNCSTPGYWDDFRHIVVIGEDRTWQFIVRDVTISRVPFDE